MPHFVCQVDVQNSAECYWGVFCCLNSFAHTYWMKMLKTLLDGHFKEVSSDVLFAEYSRGEGSVPVL